MVRWNQKVRYAFGPGRFIQALEVVGAAMFYYYPSYFLHKIIRDYFWYDIFNGMERYNCTVPFRYYRIRDQTLKKERKLFGIAFFHFRNISKKWTNLIFFI